MNTFTRYREHSIELPRGASICVRRFEDESYTRIYLYERENCVPTIIEVKKTFDEVVSLLDAGKFTYTPPVPAKLKLNFEE